MFEAETNKFRLRGPRRDPGNVISKGAIGPIRVRARSNDPELPVGGDMKTAEGWLKSFRALRRFGEGSPGFGLTLFDHYVFEVCCHGLTGEEFISNKGVLMRAFKIKQMSSGALVNVKIKVADVAAGLFDRVDLDWGGKVGGPDVGSESIKQAAKNVIPLAFELLELELLPLFDRLDDIADGHNVSRAIPQCNLGIARADGKLDFSFLVPLALAVAVGDKLFAGSCVDIEQEQLTFSSIGGEAPVGMVGEISPVGPMRFVRLCGTGEVLRIEFEYQRLTASVSDAGWLCGGVDR